MFKRGGIKSLLDRALGKGVFRVDESFVQANMQGISEEDRELMQLFINQSTECIAESDDKKGVQQQSLVNGKAPVLGAYYRIAPVPRRTCDTSPLEEIEFASRTAQPRDRAFDFPGGKEARLVEVEHNRLLGRDETKLTNVYKRRDNRGALLGALKRMRLA